MNTTAPGTSLWAIFYDLAEADREAYLTWFHDVHIPEKLARPGYTWAAHYQVTSPSGAPTSLSGPAERDGTDETVGYIAMFGGTDTRTFLNPSPAQIKPNQPPLTREMMGHRIGSQSFIATREWHVTAENRQAAESAGNNDHAVPAVAVQWQSVENDEDFGGWCVQDWLPALQAAQGFHSASKLLTTVGPSKHVTLAAFDNHSNLAEHLRTAQISEWGNRVALNVAHASGFPALASRIWPPV